MAWSDDESSRMRANVFVVGNRELDQAVATQHAHSKPKVDRTVLVAGPDAALNRFVDLAQRGLVGGESALKLIVHGAILS